MRRKRKMAKWSKYCVVYKFPEENCEVTPRKDCGRSRASAERLAEGIRNSINTSSLVDECCYGDWEKLRQSVRVVPEGDVRGIGSLDSSKRCTCPRALKHGLARKEHLKPSQVNKSELRKGIKVEMEHTSDRCTAQCIAMDHLAEIPDYYTRLARMERQAKTEGKYRG